MNANAALESAELDLSTCDLPKSLSSTLERFEAMSKYMRDICQKAPPPYVRVSVQQKSAFFDWAKKKLHTSPGRLLYRGLPVISDHEPPPAFELQPRAGAAE